MLPELKARLEANPALQAKVLALIENAPYLIEAQRDWAGNADRAVLVVGVSGNPNVCALKTSCNPAQRTAQAGAPSARPRRVAGALPYEAHRTEHMSRADAVRIKEAAKAVLYVSGWHIEGEWFACACAEAVVAIEQARAIVAREAERFRHFGNYRGRASAPEPPPRIEPQPLPGAIGPAPTMSWEDYRRAHQVAKGREVYARRLAGRAAN